MPPSEKYTAHFQEQRHYHVTCKSIDQQQLFLNDADRYFFLQKYQKFLGAFTDTLAYNLLDNHVHWILRMKSEEEIFNLLSAYDPKELTTTHKRFLGGECSFHELIEQQFNRLFISYSLSFNIIHQRKGHLFNRPFRRIVVEDDEHLSQLFVYVHANTLKHGFFKDFKNYKWSSYNSILGTKPTNLCRDYVLAWFGGKDKFIDFHSAMAIYYYEHDLGCE